MKKAILIAAFLVFGFLASNAQTEKNTLLSGGSISFSATCGSTTILSTFYIELSAWNNNNVAWVQV